MTTTISPVANNVRKKLRCEMLPPRFPVGGEKEATFKTALLLVARIDSDLTRGTGHYWTKAGELLYSLDQVVRAIIAGELMEAEG